MTAPFQELPSFGGLDFRLPTDADGPFEGHSQGWPLIVTPGTSEPTPDSLRQVLADNSNAVLDALCRFGAILFRGFDIRSENDFEQAILAIPQLQSMRSYFMSEAGRDRVNQTADVFYTNSVAQGEFLGLPVFHSENYYVWDIPAVQSFWCKKASWMGGETGFVHMPSVYEELPIDVRSRLEAEPVFAAAYPLSVIARRYGISENAVESFLSSCDIPVEGSATAKNALLYKPCVWRHPDSKRLSLQANVTLEIKELRDALRALMAPYYKGWRWTIHRLAWQYPGILNAAIIAGTVLRHPIRILKISKEMKAMARYKLSPSDAASKQRLADKVDDIAALAAAIWRHTSVLTWNEGDVVLFDNRQVLHARMPGFGKRELRVLMCNPIRIDGRSSSGVLETPGISQCDETLDVRLRRFAHPDTASQLT